MRAVIQRVSQASVEVDGRTIARIQKGLVVLAGFTAADTRNDLEYICQKIMGLRIFDDADSFMNLSLSQVNGQLLLIPQFTLYGDARKGRRPSFSEAMKPEAAAQCFDQFTAICSEQYHEVQQGQFQASMQVMLVNDGPVTILLDSSKLF